jgi:hypothetical protein
VFIRILILSFLSIGLAEAGCKKFFQKIVNEDPIYSLDRAILSEFQGSYFDLNRTDQQAITEWNRRVKSSLDRLPLSGADRGRKSGLSRAEIKNLYKELAEHPVASCKKLPKYDPKGNIGFCFGRAVTAHILALQKGMAKEGIRKIWAVGTMQADNITWGHHVATMVRGADKKWWVLDPEYGKAMDLDTWMKNVKEMDVDGKLLFLSSDAKRFGPYGADTYSSEEFSSDFYNQYFEDLMKSTRAESEEALRP